MSKFKVGDRIRVGSYGNGIIEETGSDLGTLVRFESGRRIFFRYEDGISPFIDPCTNTSPLITTIVTEVSSRANQEYPELRSMLDQLVIAARNEALDEAISNINQIKNKK